MSILERVYASGGGEIIVATLELFCSVWPAPIFICNGFKNRTFTTEDGRTVVFEASGFDVALPKKTNQGTQALTFAIENVRGTAQRLIDQALEAEEEVGITFRSYLANDPSGPAEPPINLVVRGGEMRSTKIQIQSGIADLINTQWPRDKYTIQFAPGLRYL